MEYVNREAPKPSDKYSCAPNGWMYTKEFQGIIPIEITKVFKQRKEWKGMMTNGKKNLEVIATAIDSTSGEVKEEFDLDFKALFDGSVQSKLETMDKGVLEKYKKMCEHSIIICDTNQQNRKILINALYGCLGTPYFRYYDLRNAAAITTFGQMALQWTERKVNEYMNKVCGTDDHKYVFYGDTDSLYMEMSPLIEKVGVERFGGDTQKLVDFIDRFCNERLQAALNKSSEELAEYMNSYENHLAFDREAIACPPLGSEGIGGFWKAKKRYALNVYDMEGVRYHKPHLKIMGLETQSSSTPSELKTYLYDCIEIMLQEGEKKLQEHFKKLKADYDKLDYLKITPVKSANDIAKWSDGNGFPISKCPNHVRGVLTYRRATNGFEGIPIINDGDKVMILPLREGNIFKDSCIAWPANTELPSEIKNDVLVWMDRNTLFEKTFIKPLKGMCEAAGVEYEKTASLMDLFDMF